MSLIAPSNTLTDKTIASTFDQLLFTDDASGIADNSLKVVASETGKTALQVSNNNILIKSGGNADHANLFEVDDKDGNSLFNINSSSDMVSITAPLTINTATVTYSQATTLAQGGSCLTLTGGNILVPGKITLESDSPDDNNVIIDGTGTDSLIIDVDSEHGWVNYAPSFNKHSDGSRLGHFYGTGTANLVTRIGFTDKAYTDPDQIYWVYNQPNSDGGCGIGTLTPEERLHVHGDGECEIKVESSNNTACLKVTAASSLNYNSTLKMQVAGGNQSGGYLRYIHNDTTTEQAWQWTGADGGTGSGTILMSLHQTVGTTVPYSRLNIGSSATPWTSSFKSVPLMISFDQHPPTGEDDVWELDTDSTNNHTPRHGAIGMWAGDSGNSNLASTGLCMQPFSWKTVSGGGHFIVEVGQSYTAFWFWGDSNDGIIGSVYGNSGSRSLSSLVTHHSWGDCTVTAVAGKRQLKFTAGENNGLTPWGFVFSYAGKWALVERFTND